MCAHACGVKLPRDDADGMHYGFLDTCGGHTRDYHFHRDPSCLYTNTAATIHSAQVGKVLGGKRRRQLSSTHSDARRRLCDDGAKPICSNGATAGPPPNGCTDGGKPTCKDGSTAGPPGGGMGGGGTAPPGGGPGGGGSGTVNGQLLYGLYEDYSKNTLPLLDACGGSYGVTPDSAGKIVYHYHTQVHPPFSLGCIGPNTDGSLVSVAQCRAVNADKCR